MKNRYEIRGDVTAIFLTRRDGTILETLIDTEDLEHVKDFEGSWYAKWSEFTETFYVRGNLKQEDGSFTGIELHRHIMNASKGTVVDHVNNNTRDNRKSNLRFSDASTNGQNRNGANRNSTSGIRGVSYRKDNKKWLAKATINRVPYYLGQFDTKDDAERAVVKFRAEHMPFSSDAHRRRSG